MKTQFFNYFNTFKTYSIQDKFIVCFLGALTLTCLALFIMAFITLGLEVSGFAMASAPLIFMIDTERGKGKREDRIKQTKSLLNDTCGLWFNNILIGGGEDITESRKDMTKEQLTSYYGSKDETTLSQLTIIKPPKSQELMDILLDGLKEILNDSIIFCVVQNKLTSFEQVVKFNTEYKNKPKGDNNNTNQNKSK